MKQLLLLLYSLTFLYLLTGFLLFVYQRSLIYYPTAEYTHNYETQIFQHDNETIKTIVLNKGKNKAILYFGGNAEAVINNAQSFSRIFSDFTLYLVNYRGYGGSSGEPQEQALYADALFIYDRIKTKHTTLSVIGRSLGSGIASYLAAHRKIDKMLLITPFDSLENIAQHYYPVFPASLLLKEKYDSIARVSKITAWTLIILAQHDTIIPRQNSMRLARRFPASQLSIKTIQNTGHNTISNNAEFYILLSQFINNSK